MGKNKEPRKKLVILDKNKEPGQKKVGKPSNRGGYYSHHSGILSFYWAWSLSANLGWRPRNLWDIFDCFPLFFKHLGVAWRPKSVYESALRDIVFQIFSACGAQTTLYFPSDVGGTIQNNNNNNPCSIAFIQIYIRFCKIEKHLQRRLKHSKMDLWWCSAPQAPKNVCFPRMPRRIFSDSEYLVTRRLVGRERKPGDRTDSRIFLPLLQLKSAWIYHTEP